MPACGVRSCGVGGRLELERRPGCREAVSGTVGRRRPLEACCSRQGGPGGEPTRGRVVGRAALCLPAVQSRACVDAWAGAASGGSFRDVALVAVWGLRIMMHREQVDQGKSPDNAYSQGGQELNASAGAC